MIGTTNNNFSTSFKQTGHRLGTTKGLFTFHSNRLATWAGAAKGFITSFNRADLSGLVQPTDSSLPLHAGLFDLLSSQLHYQFLQSNKLAIWAGAAKGFFTFSTGLAFWIWQPIHSSIQLLLASAVFIYPRGHSLPV